MLCPHCECPESKVLETRKNGKETVRRRKCLDCAEHFWTTEFVDVSAKRPSSYIPSEYAGK